MRASTFGNAAFLQWIVWSIALFPVSALSLEQGSDDPAISEWLEIQTGQSRQEKIDWWRHIDPEKLNVYLQAGADVNVSDRHGWTPLHSAARYNEDREVLDALLEAGAVVDARNKSGDTALHWAAADNSNVEIVIALIEAGADVNARDRFGWLPIHTAAENNSNPEIIETLLAAGANHKKRAYFVLFRPRFLLKHNSDISDADKKNALATLKEAR